MTPADELLSLVYPDLATRVRRVYEDMRRIHNLPMRPCQGFRSWAAEDALYEQGRTLPGPVVTWAKGGESLHNFGAAVDSCFVGKDPWLDHHPQSTKMWQEYGRFAKAHGLYWGGDFTHPKEDRPHVELPYGQSLHDLRVLYAINRLTSIWTKFDKIRGVPAGSEWAANLRSKEGTLYA